MTANSSPPSRATISVSRRHVPSRSATVAQQFIADRMAESVVDALEMIEIEAMHGEAARRAGATPRQQRFEPLTEQDAVWQIGQRIVMRHIGDARFGLLALGDVDDRDHYRMRFAKRNAARIGQDFDLAAVGLDVTPGPVGLIAVAD